MKKRNKKLPEQSKSKNLDVKTMKGGSETSSVAGSVENSKANGDRVSTNGSEDLAGDNLEGGVVAMVKTKVVETEIEVNDEGYSENVHDTYHDGEIEVNGDGIGASDGISLLVDVSSEMGREDSNDFYERETDRSLNGKRGNPDGKIREMGDSEDGEEEDSSDGEYEFCVGDFVWGKIKSHPWWPGQVYDSSDASDYALKVKRRDRILVAYFDGTFAWCHPSQLKPFEKNFEELLKQSSSKNFDNAVQKAVDEIGRLVELKITCTCVPKESLVGLARPLAMNSGIKPGVLVPEDGIAKLWSYLFGPAECLTLLKHVAQVASINNRLEFKELKCWLSAFYRVNGGYHLALYHDPQPIPGLEDNSQNWVLDSSRDPEVPIQGSVEEETNQSLLQNCVGDSENGQYQRRKQKSIAEIMEWYVDPQVKNVEDVMKEGTSLANSAPPSWKKKRKGDDEATGGSSSSSKPKTRKVARLLESTLAAESEIPSIERDASRAKEEIKKVLVSREKKKNKGSRIESDTWGKEETKASPVSIERKTVQRDDGGAKEQTEKGILSRERKKSKYLSPPFTIINKRQSKKGIEAESLKAPSESQWADQMTRDVVNVVGSESRPILMYGDEVPQKKNAKDVGPDHEKSNNSSPETLKLDQSATIDRMKVKVSPNEVLSGIRSTAIDLNSLEKNNCLDVVEEFLSVFRSSVYCNGSNYKIYNKRPAGRKRKILDSEPGPSAKYKTQTDQKSPEQRSRQMKVRKNEEAKMKDDSEKLCKSILKQARQTPDLKTRHKETDGKEKSDKPKLKPASRAPDTKTKDRDTDGKGKPGKPKLKPTAMSQDKKRKDKETDGKAAPVIIANDMETEGTASPPSLFVTFGPGSYLRSKNDLIKIYRKFGSLNEEETEMFNKFCARVVFLSSSGAEEAFTSSQLASPFGDSNVNFQLQNCSSTAKVRKFKQISNAKPFPAKEACKTREREPATKSSVGKASAFNYMKLKLEMIASVLENSDGKMSSELKSQLEGEVKDLLELLKKVVGSSSS